jgi:hypothetical protein
MKPLYIFLLLWAVFITGLADGISWALLPLPGLGFILALVITFCINATMGAGLIFLLISQSMWHPKFGPVATILGVLPPFNVLPLWLGLVIAGIVHDMGKEKGAVGEIAKLADTLQSTKNPFTRAASVMSTSKNIERLTTGRPPQAANDNEPENVGKETSRTRTELRSPNLAPHMNSDIAPARTQHYAKAA